MQKAIELKIKGKTLRGMRHYPNLKEKYPMVILFHGFTGDKLEPHRIFLKLSRLLVSEGLGVIRFDFSGSGESDGYFEEMTFSGEVSEAQQILEYVKDLPSTDPERIGVVGLSMGGAIASIIAGTNSATVKALVLWSAVDIETMVDIYQNKVDQGDFIRNQKGSIDIGGSWLNHGFYDDLRDWDTYETAKKYPGPVLLVHGTKDQIAPAAIAEKYQHSFPGRAETIYVDEADHTYNRHDWEARVLSETTVFLKQELSQLE